MRFFGRKKKKGDDSQARRSARVLLSRVRHGAGIALAVVCVIAAGVGLWRNHSLVKAEAYLSEQFLTRTASAGFRVNEILVTGRNQVSTADIIGRLSIKKDMPIFGVDIAAAQKSLTDISWVKSVSVTRRLPDGIVVELQERAPVALWQYNRKISLIDADGVVLTDEGLGAFRHLPLIVGEGAPAHVTELAGLLAAEPAVASQLVSATRIGGRRWDMRLQNGLLVRLPEKEIELALRTLAKLQEEKNVFGRDVRVIDLRQPDRVVMTPAPGAIANNNDKKA